ncbi:hypothetical protein EJN92_04110 [Undibacterium parvum]|uniref:Uncharacterized protein n=2 Tax=Undibacterium parvum TaxID=401471 RepID=A0A3Q9BQ84_9BURK|nr:hypothetical protein EJN92_04110 [Undibacterium parvum]
MAKTKINPDKSRQKQRVVAASIKRSDCVTRAEVYGIGGRNSTAAALAKLFMMFWIRLCGALL